MRKDIECSEDEATLPQITPTRPLSHLIVTFNHPTRCEGFPPLRFPDGCQEHGSLDTQDEEMEPNRPRHRPISRVTETKGTARPPGTRRERRNATLVAAVGYIFIRQTRVTMIRGLIFTRQTLVIVTRD